jgi:hypothetical protein
MATKTERAAARKKPSAKQPSAKAKRAAKRATAKGTTARNGEIIVERHRALNWLIRYQGQDGDHVTTDT